MQSSSSGEPSATPGSWFEVAYPLVVRLLGRALAAVVVIGLGLSALVWMALPDAMRADFIDQVRHRQSWGTLGGTLAGFEVLELTRVVDLTGWAPAVNEIPQDVALHNDIYRIRRTRPDAKLFCTTAGSTGKEMVPSSSTHRIHEYDMRDFARVGWPMMKKQILIAADIPASDGFDTAFEYHLTTRRVGGYADPNANFCAIGIWHPTRMLDWTVLFPSNKLPNPRALQPHPPTLRYAYYNDLEQMRPVPEDDYTLDIVDNRLHCRIANPVLGYAYRIDWEW